MKETAQEEALTENLPKLAIAMAAKIRQKTEKYGDFTDCATDDLLTSLHHKVSLLDRAVTGTGNWSDIGRQALNVINIAFMIWSEVQDTLVLLGKKDEE